MPPKIATVAKIGTEAPHWGDFRLSDYDIQGHTQIRHAPDEIDFLENVLLVFCDCRKISIFCGTDVNFWKIQSPTGGFKDKCYILPHEKTADRPDDAGHAHAFFGVRHAHLRGENSSKSGLYALCRSCRP